MNKELNRVVVTGMGVISPIGNDIDTFWESVAAGKSGADGITKFDASNFKTKFAAEVKNFNPHRYFEKNEARKYDLFTQYAVAASEEALQNADVDFDLIDKKRVGVIWGSGNGGTNTFQEQVIEFAKGNGVPRFNPFFIPKIIGDIPSGVISIRHGFQGLNFSTVSACASSNHAIIDAVNYIRLGRADMIIAGGSEASINESSIGGFNASKALSTNNDNPAKASRPFDVLRDGFVMGEGAGALILESLASAQKRNAKIIAEVIGTGMAADAYHLTGTHPEGEGAYLGMLDALNDANLQASEVDYINPHATSTSMGDQSELIAIRRVFGERKDLAISGTKSMTGHLLGAAGVVEAIISILAIKHSIIPPTINTENVEPEFANLFDFVLSKPKKKNVEIVLNNTFGFGGHIATTIFKKWNNK